MSGTASSIELAEEVVLNVCQSNLQAGSIETVRNRLQQKCLALKNSVSNSDIAKLAVYFADDVMNRQANDLGLGWASIESDPEVFGTGQGAEDFYKITNQYLGKMDPDGRAVQEFAFKCLALGFVGIAAAGTPKNQDLLRALKDTLKIREAQTIVFPDRDHQPDERQLWKKPTRWLQWIGVAVCAAMVGLFCMYFWLFHQAHNEIDSTVKALNEKAHADP